jgi:hypothetical protein
MYLALDVREDGIFASVKNDGNFKYASLGTANTQLAHAPAAVMRIQAFDGIDCITDEQIIAELMRRFSTKDIIRILGIRLSSEDLLRLLELRLKMNQ